MLEHAGRLFRCLVIPPLEAKNGDPDMSSQLNGKSVAILAANGFEEAELFSPKEAIEAAGGNAIIVSLESGEIEANRHREKGRSIRVDRLLDDASAGDFDALVVPGGLFSPDALRVEDKAKSFVRDFFDQKKPVASICHGPQLLIDADVVSGRKMTAIENIRTDLKNAGANVVDSSVVVDEGLVTSRTPDDLPDFCAKLVEEICEGQHAAQAQSV
tara:strand:+ start:453 stop:1097 length:645 start_codon:yes stop_codon:yes gene_type:complete